MLGSRLWPHAANGAQLCLSKSRRSMLQVGRRVLLASSLFFCGCGCVLMMDVGVEPISLVRYLSSLSIILAFTNILEGVTMSMMGDVIHPLMAAGFWNAGASPRRAPTLSERFTVVLFCVTTS